MSVQVRSIPQVRPVYLIAGAIALMAIASRIAIPLPFTPVPLTLQVFVVVLTALTLGAKQSAAVQLAYLGLIAVGLPLTAHGIGGPAAFVSTTGGYLIGFIPASYLAGVYKERTHATVLNSMIAGILAITIIYLCGAAWLAIYLHNLTMAWLLGVIPFILADLAKVAAAALIVHRPALRQLLPALGVPHA